MTKKLLPTAAVLALAVAAAPALADKPDQPGHPAKPAHPAKPQTPKASQGNGQGATHPGAAKRCRPHKVGYVVGGTLVSQTLTKNADGSYDGTVVVKVVQANKVAKSLKGTNQTYTLDNARVKFDGSDRDGNKTVDALDLRAGDRVHVIGKTTRLNKKCDTTGFTATTTIRQVVFHDAKAPETQQPTAPTDGNSTPVAPAPQS